MYIYIYNRHLRHKRPSGSSPASSCRKWRCFICINILCICICICLCIYNVYTTRTCVVDPLREVSRRRLVENGVAFGRRHRDIRCDAMGAVSTREKSVLTSIYTYTHTHTYIYIYIYIYIFKWRSNVDIYIYIYLTIHLSIDLHTSKYSLRCNGIVLTSISISIYRSIYSSINLSIYMYINLLCDAMGAVLT